MNPVAGGAPLNPRFGATADSWPASTCFLSGCGFQQDGLHGFRILIKFFPDHIVGIFEDFLAAQTGQNLGRLKAVV